MYIYLRIRIHIHTNKPLRKFLSLFLSHSHRESGWDWVVSSLYTNKYIDMYTKIYTYTYTHISIFRYLCAHLPRIYFQTETAWDWVVSREIIYIYYIYTYVSTYIYKYTYMYTYMRISKFLIDIHTRAQSPRLFWGWVVLSEIIWDGYD